jgi:hypothetical protein
MKAISKRKDREKVNLKKNRQLKRATMKITTKRKNLEKEHQKNDSLELCLKKI